MEALFDDYVDTVREISLKAGQAILEVYHNEDFNIVQKSDDSPLTLADKRSNDCIVAGLQAINPSIPIISEESEEIPYQDRKEFEYCWIVDPLDGTKEFIKRNGEFTVNIALAKNGVIVLGVVYAPVSQIIYWAVKNKGAFKSDKTQNITRLQALNFTITEENLIVVCSRSHLNQTTQQYIDQLNNPKLSPKGSSLKMMEIAAGQAHIYPRFGPTMEWDTAASQIIVEEAGGQLFNPATQEALIYNKENLLNPHFIALGNPLD